MQGVFIGYHTHAGGLWSGDYIVAEYAPFMKDCDATRAKVKVHHIREVVRNMSGQFVFPVAERRRERALKEEFDAPDEMP
jgi:hypothetical protein